MADPETDRRLAGLEDPFVAAVMSTAHPETVEEIVRSAELAAVPGQVECGHSHADLVAAGLPCPSCGAQR